MKYILAIDQGTTSCRAIVFDKGGRTLGLAQKEFKQIYPGRGWVEHDPLDIKTCQYGVITEALVRAGVGVADIEAIGITNQRETTVVWDRFTGEPIYNAIVWQCRRTAEYSEKLKKEGYSDFIYSRTGLIPDAYFSATKIKWILDNVEGARERAGQGGLCFGTIDTFLMWQLSGGKIFSTDYTNASRTMLFNIHTLEWDDELLKLFNIPRSMLPEVKPSSYFYGATSSALFGKEIPICGVAGDQQAALFGQTCFNKNDVKCTYGTGCFMLMNTGEKPVKSGNGLVTTLAASTDKKPVYALEGSVFIGGAVVQWLRDGLGLISSASESEAAAIKAKNSGGIYMVPAFVGLGAPYWDSEASGIISGLTRATKREHIIRAALESIAYQVNDILSSMRSDTGEEINRLNVDGGASANNFLMQFQADISGLDIIRPVEKESTALGAAYLAGLGSGYWKDLNDVLSNRRPGEEFSGKISEEERKKLLSGWANAVARSRLK